jgi:preprotein translocase subunit YajC
LLGSFAAAAPLRRLPRSAKTIEDEEGRAHVQDGGQLLLLLVLIVFTVWVFTRGRRQQRAAQLTQSRLQAGVEVMTTSGLYGRVVEVTDGSVVRLETSPGVVSRWDRRAVARIVSTPGPEPALEDEPAEPLAADPVGAQPVDLAEGEVMARSEPVLPVEPGRPEDTATARTTDSDPAAFPPGPPVAEPPGPVASPKDSAPPDRG